MLLKTLLNMCKQFCEKNGWKLGGILGGTDNESVFIWIFVHLWNPLMYGKSGSSSLVSNPNEVRTALWLSITSEADKSVRI